MGWYRAVALDLDGTLTTGGWPSGAVLQRIDRTRGEGVRMLLVTGRILSELDVEFPGLSDHFDVVVAENGGVLRLGSWTRTLADPVDTALLQQLQEAGLPVRRGQVLLATQAAENHVVLDAVEALGLDVQLIRNRNALMLLPAGVTKGTGLRAALVELGVSSHNTIAVGDAENDHALLAAAGLGVAVANAVESLRHRADLVLADPDGAGVAALLDGPVMSGEQRLHSRRRPLVLGVTTDGGPVTMPSAQTNLLIRGGSESGKSYLAGLLIEQMTAQGYVVLVVDPEGDHLWLGALRGVTVLAGSALPDPATALMSCSVGMGSVVLDLSHLSASDREAYLTRLWPALVALRAETSLPHWLVVDEAQDLPPQHLPLLVRLALDGGICLVSYQPERIEPALRQCVEWEVSLPEGGAGAALLLPPAGAPVLFRVGGRSSPHVRHRHKYVDSDLPEPKGFTFDLGPGDPHPHASTLREFVIELETVPARVVEFHAGRGDFSRWLADTYRDHLLASLVATAEQDLLTSSDPERTRHLLIELISRRYFT